MLTRKNNLIQAGRATVMVDGQFGSTGKGVFAAFVAAHNKINVATSNAGPNSGHTAIFDGEPKVAYHLPMSGAMAGLSGHYDGTVSYLNAGAIIDPLLLMEEMKTFGLSRGNVVVHPHAAVVLPQHKLVEAALTSAATGISSTQKGVGEALAYKIRREEHATFADYAQYSDSNSISVYDGLNVEDINILDLTSCMTHNQFSVFIEVSQGFSLSLNASGMFPYTTSRDCTLNQALSDANVHPYFLYRTIMTMRTYPIRVGNIKDAKGSDVGYSGPGYKDQRELEWNDIGVKPEYTTVTKRMRRVFTWSYAQTLAAMRANRPTDIYLNFCNYLARVDQLDDILESIRKAADYVGLPQPMIWYGFGPNHMTDIVDGYSQAVNIIRERGIH